MPPPDFGYAQQSYQTSFDKFQAGPSSLPATATIKDIYPLVMAEQPDSIDRAADGWVSLVKSLDKTHTALIQRQNKLKPEWVSDTATRFNTLVDHTTNSLSNWHDAAARNVTTMKDLAQAIRAVQQAMVTLWNEFGKAIDAAAAKQQQGHGLLGDLGDIVHPSDWDLNPLDSIESWVDGLKLGWKGETELDPVLEEYTNRAKTEIVEKLNQAYTDAFLELQPGAKFQGPTNAKYPTKQQLIDVSGLSPKTIQLPGLPSGALPALPPSPAPAVPNVPGPPAAAAANEPALPPAVAPESIATPTAPAPAVPAVPDLSPPSEALPPAPAMPLPVAPNVTVPKLPSLPTAEMPNGLDDGAPVPLPPSTAGITPVMPGVAPLNAATAPPGLGPANLPPVGDELAPTTIRPPMPPGMLRGLQGRGGPVNGEPELPAGIPRGLKGRGGVADGEPELPPGMRTVPPQLGGRKTGPTESTTRPPGSTGSGPEEPGLPPFRGAPPLLGRNQRSSTKPDLSDYDRTPSQQAKELERMGGQRGLLGTRDNRLRWQRPGSPEAEELPSRQLPTMTGRLGPNPEPVTETPESVQRALPRGLDGMRSATAQELANKRPRSDRHREQANREAPVIDFVGDSDLFKPEQVAPSVIDKPDQPKPVAADKVALSPRPVG